jgi:hypothetical protein
MLFLRSNNEHLDLQDFRVVWMIQPQGQARVIRLDLLGVLGLLADGPASGLDDQGSTAQLL